jgi:hypothetical protein
MTQCITLVKTFETIVRLDTAFILTLFMIGKESMKTQFALGQEEWDRRVSEQLYARYTHINWTHKTQLRPTVIRLFDSDSHWGKWEAETRTIWIARRLVLNYSWFCVESILRHEMAHQLMSEQKTHFFRPDMQRGPHGEAFKECCRKLGVPEEFRGATINLQSSVLDWKKQKQSEESEKLLSRVEKLLALATSSNEHEALLAMNKVRELYAKYNIDHYLFEDRQQSQKKMAHLIICHKKKRIEAHQNKTAAILVEHFFVRVIFCSEFDAHTGENYQALKLVGTRENVLMAEYVYYFLLQQTDALVKNLKREKKKLSRVAAKSYRLGILEGFRNKLVLSDQQVDQQTSAGIWSLAGRDQRSATAQTFGKDLVSIGQALSLLSSDEGLEDYLAAIYPRLTRTGGRGQTIDTATYSAGERAGENLRLHRAMTSEDGNRGRLLR